MKLFFHVSWCVEMVSESHHGHTARWLTDEKNVSVVKAHACFLLNITDKHGPKSSNSKRASKSICAVGEGHHKPSLWMSFSRGSCISESITKFADLKHFWEKPLGHSRGRAPIVTRVTKPNLCPGDHCLSFTLPFLMNFSMWVLKDFSSKGFDFDRLSSAPKSWSATSCAFFKLSF